MTRRSVRAMFLALLLTALAMFCLSDLVQAAAPDMETMGCASRLCDEASGCGTMTSKSVAAPIATVAASVVVAIPASITVLRFDPAPLAYWDRQVTPLASRSPPSA